MMRTDICLDTLTEAEIMIEVERPKRKCVILLSGGLDSTVLMYSLVNDYMVFPLTLEYGQRHSKEVMAARNVCEARDHNLLMRWKCVNLSVLKSLLPSALTGIGEIPKGHYEDESMKQTVVPNRNMILLAIASGYAQGLGAKYVAYGAHRGDHVVYPDCRPRFVEALSVAIKLGTGWEDEGVELLTPFVQKTKADLVKLGEKLNVPFERTYSCYEGGPGHCGSCGTCTERREAFQLAGVKDPTVYIT